MCINLIYRLYGIYYEQHILYKIGTYIVQSTTPFESNRIKLSPSSSFQRMNALARVRSRLFSSPYLVNLRDIASANSTPTIDFPLEVQSRETGFSRDYTFRRLPELGSRAGSEKFTSTRSRNRRCDLSQLTLGYRDRGCSGSMRSKEPGWISEVYGDERSSCRGKCSYICWDTTERSLSRSPTRLSPLSVSPLAIESVLILDIQFNEKCQKIMTFPIGGKPIELIIFHICDKSFSLRKL